MKYKFVPNFFFAIMAIITGAALFRQVDLQNWSLEKPALAILYLIVFIFCIGFMIRRSKNKSGS